MTLAGVKHVYTVIGFEGHFPVGTAAIVVAKDRGHARRLLIEEGKQHGLALNEEDLGFDMFIEAPLENHCLILCDGNY